MCGVYAVLQQPTIHIHLRARHQIIYYYYKNTRAHTQTSDVQYFMERKFFGSLIILDMRFWYRRSITLYTHDYNTHTRAHNDERQLMLWDCAYSYGTVPYETMPSCTHLVVVFMAKIIILLVHCGWKKFKVFFLVHRVLFATAVVYEKGIWHRA